MSGEQKLIAIVVASIMFFLTAITVTAIIWG